MKKELFNLKTVERFSSKIKLNNKQKVAAKSWLYLLEQGKLKKEKLNYIKFVEYILKDLLGYDIRKDMDFEAGNIEFSFKNKQGKTILGIEAKGTKTKDLFAEQKGYREGQKTPVNQLWTYMGKLNLDYGIATNYKDFVLIDRAKGSSTYHFFDFEEVKNNDNKLKEFIAIFSKEQIIDNNFVEKLKEESDIEERNFTKEFYKLFHETRLMLVKEFQENGVSKEESIHYAQLFLNRLMFVFFAEDTSKLEKRLFENLIVKVLDSGMPITEHSNFISEAIRGFFVSLDKGSQTSTKIFGFNGGLFGEEISPTVYFKDLRNKKFYVEIYQHSKLKKEPELDPISKKIFLKYENRINPIIKNLLIMASFDFNTEVSVNILGHIFEQSLSDLEELKEGKITKRKKEGIYYTPEYITDYICRNTILPYLSKGKASTPRDLVLEHQKNIKELEEKFASIKILDPACGSGAFLIKAVDILLEIHKEIQLFKQDKGEYTAIKKGRKKKKDEGQLMLIKWNEEDEAREIIEKNIFGVDINEESVEITKLGLFLKIAKKNKKLIDLSKNIKFGNSLIDDKNIDERAFDWEKEFPFKFDIVIGNPPYVRQERFTEIKPYLERNYEVYSGVADLYTYFYEKGIHLLKQNGILGFISSNKWMKVKYGLGLRKLLKNKRIIGLIDFFELKVFESASTEPIIVILKNSDKSNAKIKVALIETLKFDNFYRCIDEKTIPINQGELDDDGWNLSQTESKEIINKIRKDSQLLGEYVNKKIYSGIKTGANHILVINKEKYDKILKKDKSSKQIIKPLIQGTEIGKYTYRLSGKYLIVTKKGININQYPAVKEYLLEYKKELAKRSDIVGKGQWFELRQCAYYDEFEQTKIVYIHTAKKHKFALDENKNYVINNCYFLNSSSRYLLAYLNSKLFEYYKINTFVAFGDAKGKGRCKLDYNKMVKVPIKPIDNNLKKQFDEIVNEVIKLNKEFYEKRDKFFNRIKNSFSLEKINKKLGKFYELEFNEFIKEIEKQTKKKISLKEQDEWEDYFNDYTKEILRLESEIEKTDKEIDNMVYKLYGLTKEEIKIIKDNTK